MWHHIGGSIHGIVSTQCPILFRQLEYLFLKLLCNDFGNRKVCYSHKLKDKPKADFKGLTVG